MSGHLLFVYGTLRRGGVNAITKLYPEAAFIGVASTRGRLYDMGGYPAIVLNEEGTRVAGEIYEIDELILTALDEFEIEAGYNRERIEIMLNGDALASWIYRPDPEMCDGRRVIAGGDWIEHAGIDGLGSITTG